MNRRNFLSLSSLLTLAPFMGAKKAVAQPQTSSMAQVPECKAWAGATRTQGASLADGPCSCAHDGGHQVQPHLDREILVTQGCWVEHQAEIQYLECISRIRDSHYRGMLPKWAVE